MQRLHVTKHNFWHWYSWMETFVCCLHDEHTKCTSYLTASITTYCMMYVRHNYSGCIVLNFPIQGSMYLWITMAMTQCMWKC